MPETEVTYDQGRFAREKELVDWGVLVTDGQGGPAVYVVALSREDAVALLEGAARAVAAEEDGGT